VKRRAVFLDRDGTLIREKGYLSDPEKLELEPGAAEAVQILNRSGLPVVLVTNQSGIARGFYDEGDLEKVHLALHGLLERERARLDAVYACPHHPEGAVEAYRKRCSCRKPAIGMLRKAEKDLDLQLSGSYLVGDKRSDIQCARDGGLVGILVTTGYGQKEWELSIQDPGSPEPDLVAGSLMEAVRRILAEERTETALNGIGEACGPPWTCKFVSWKHLQSRLAVHRERGKTVVLANGVFDLLHAGHVQYLQAARREGDLLIVGVNDDASTTALKGAPRPVFPAAERIAVLSALACVDYCVLFREPTADRLLEAIRPEVHAKGTDYTEDTVPEKETVERYGGRVKIVGPPKIRSSSDTFRSISGGSDD